MERPSDGLCEDVQEMGEDGLQLTGLISVSLRCWNIQRRKAPLTEEEHHGTAGAAEHGEPGDITRK